MNKKMMPLFVLPLLMLTSCGNEYDLPGKKVDATKAQEVIDSYSQEEVDALELDNGDLTTSYSILKIDKSLSDLMKLKAGDDLIPTTSQKGVMPPIVYQIEGTLTGAEGIEYYLDDDNLSVALVPTEETLEGLDINAGYSEMGVTMSDVALTIILNEYGLLDDLSVYYTMDFDNVNLLGTNVDGSIRIHTDMDVSWGL